MKLQNYLVFLAVILLMISCNKSDDNASGTGDAIIVAKKSGTETVYGISLYAYTFSAFKSVTVVSSADDSKTYTLNANQGYKTNFYYETPDDEFTTTQPAAGAYNFSAVFENGASQNFQDELSDKVLTIPSIQSLEFDSISNTLTVNWSETPNADSYAINIMDGPNILFGSVELSNALRTYAISTTGGGWVNAVLPVTGKSYTVRLYAFLYEGVPDAYNVQATSIGEMPYIWGK